MFTKYSLPTNEHSGVQNNTELRTPIILLVDDDEDQLFLFKVFLERTNCIVVTALSAQEALEILDQIHVDLVVSDINMPNIDGREMISRLRKMSDLAKLPVIAFTAAPRYAEEDLLLSGADMFCLKTETKTLVNQINELLQRQDTNVSLLSQIRERFAH